ncbi:MAG: phage tail protein, partial [Rhodothermales bacterium]|nr:phage tail protein [Rhodothermales bacterium]
MTRFDADTLYRLLPAVYRIRDAEQARDPEEGGPLRALIDVLAQQAAVVERDIDRLYDNWFIETCDEWVVPYIGDLLGVRNLHVVEAGADFSQRARVANTIGYRRRKGTATMLEQLARDTTGWPARAVEFFELLATTQHVNHVRLHNVRTPDLRDTAQLELIGTAFDTAAHTADVRRIAEGRGRHNIPNVGLFLWRLQPYVVPLSEARAAADPPDGRYRFHPFGLDVPRFNPPQTEREITHLAEEINVPGPLRRRPLYDELEARRQTLAEGGTPEVAYFGETEFDPSAVRVYLDGAYVPAEEVMICDLTNWRRPAATQTYTVLDESVDPPAPVDVDLPIAVAVDPVLGRLTLAEGATDPDRVEVSSAYGFPGDVGGGPYSRRDSVDAVLDRPVDWHVGVGRDVAADGTTLFNTLTDAVVAWNARDAATPGGFGLIAILDNGTYAENLTGPGRIEIGEGSRLLVVAADWPEQPERGSLEPLERRAHVLGNVTAVGTAPPSSETPGELILDGLLIEGSVTVLVGHLGRLRLAHATLGLHDPDAPAGLTVNASVNPAQQNPELAVELDHSLAGPVVVPETVRSVRVADSVLQAARTNGTRGPVLSAAGGEAGPPATIVRATLLGGVHVRELALGSETLFTEAVVAERLQTGCVRFSYVPAGSRTPRRYRCQPDLALRERADALELESVADLSASEIARIRLRL